jgi:hypothetical protein
MSELIVYATHKDADAICAWINAETNIAWIVKVAQEGHSYQWRAVESIESISEQSYALWHIGSEPLNIPSGHRDVPDAIVANPFQGWSQTLETTRATAPWFGSALPGPYVFRFAESGRETSRSLGRSGFSWAMDRYKSIGKPAHPNAKRWWSRLRRFLAQSSTQIAWSSSSAARAYVFPDALFQINQGRPRDANP